MYMTHRIKYFFTLPLLLALCLSCKQEVKPIADNSAKVNLVTNTNTKQEQSIDTQKAKDTWRFYNYYKIGNNSDEDKEITDEIKRKFEDISLQLSDDAVTIIGVGKEEIYSDEINSSSFFEHHYMLNFYRKFLKKEFSLELGDNVFSIRNKNAHVESSILKSFFDDAFVIDNFLFFEYNRYVVCFKNGYFNSDNSGNEPEYQETVSLPIKYSFKNDLKKIMLPHSKYSVEITKDYEDAFIAMLPKKELFQPLVFSGCYPSGHCNQFLVILNEQNKEISRLRIYYNDAPDGNIEKYSLSTYEIDTDYNIKLIISEVEEDLDNDKEISRKSIEKIYEITSSGSIEEK